MTPRQSKFVLTSHITFSVGWLGAVAVFLALALTGVTSRDVQLARAAYLAMEVSGWLVIVPFCLASLLTGLIEALGTKWGLFKHYWVLVKLVLTVAATIALLLHMQPIREMANAASETTFLTNVVPRLPLQLVADSGAAFLLLLAITTISVYKPWGRIQYRSTSNKNQSVRLQIGEVLSVLSWRLYALILVVGVVLFILVKHLIAGGMGHH